MRCPVLFVLFAALSLPVFSVPVSLGLGGGLNSPLGGGGDNLYTQGYLVDAAVSMHPVSWGDVLAGGEYSVLGVRVSEGSQRTLCGYFGAGLRFPVSASLTARIGFTTGYSSIQYYYDNVESFATHAFRIGYELSLIADTPLKNLGFALFAGQLWYQNIVTHENVTNNLVVGVRINLRPLQD